jgi:hypothetical protein
MQLISKPVEGKILFPQKLLAEVTANFNGKQVIATFNEFNPKKTDQKRRLYYASIVAPMSEETGESKDKMHEDLKLACNPIEAINLRTGEVNMVGGSTKKFDGEEWDAFMERCRELAKYINVKLMTPSEYYESISNPNDEQTPIGE